MGDCIACSEALPTDGQFITCIQCRFGYHLGSRCSGISEKTFRSMSVVKRQEWCCKTCRINETRSVTSTGETSSMQRVIDRILVELVSVRTAVSEIPVLSSKVDALSSLKSTIETLLPLKDAMGEVTKSITFLSDQYDEMLKSRQESENQLKALKSRVDVLESVLQDQSALIRQQQISLNQSEQYSRTLNLEIHGITAQPNEDLRAFLADFAKKIDIGFEPAQVQAVHRLPVGGDKIPPILVRFVSVAVRNKWLAARKRVRQLSFCGELPTNTYVNENLTALNRELLWKSKLRAKEQGYRFVWVKNGKVLVKKDEGQQVLFVASVGDLVKIV